MINLGIVWELKLDMTFTYHLQIQKLQILIDLISSHY